MFPNLFRLNSKPRGDFAQRELNSVRDPQVSVRDRAAQVALIGVFPAAAPLPFAPPPTRTGWSRVVRVADSTRIRR
jgi:hypothetical protein